MGLACHMSTILLSYDIGDIVATYSDIVRDRMSDQAQNSILVAQ